MSEVAIIKRDLRAAIEACRPDGTYDDDTCERIHALVDALTPLNPTPRPIDQQDFVAGQWRSQFAQFGPKHTAGKPIRHDSSLKLQSFNVFPDIPIRVDDIVQDIGVADRHYNNVIEIMTPDEAHRAQLVVWGRYDLAPATPQRYEVEFYAVEIVPPPGVDARTILTRFGMAADAPPRRELKPPKLHSDVVFCDADMRINRGSMGGLYVLDRVSPVPDPTKAARPDC